jgi:hypothetical protein
MTDGWDGKPPGGLMLAAGLVDEVRMDVPVVFGSGKRYFGS